MVDTCEFRVPVHAVDVELEIPGRFFVKDVWELEDDSTTEQCEALEGGLQPCARFLFPPNTVPTLNHTCAAPATALIIFCFIFAGVAVICRAGVDADGRQQLLGEHHLQRGV